MTPVPLAASIYWHLPILLIVVSLVYSATRHDNWKLIRNEALRWGSRMALFLGGIALALFLIDSYLTPSK
jgi:uncharacterized membrane protein YjfL (UPF0719 family)